MERAIDLSDEEHDISLSSSAYDLSNEPVVAVAAVSSSLGYENVVPVSDVPGYENVRSVPGDVRSVPGDAEDAYSGYVCVRAFSADDSSSSEGEDEQVLPAEVHFSSDRLAVGSGSLVSAKAISEGSRIQKHFAEAFSLARKRMDRESIDEQLERALALPERRVDEMTRKYALVLDLIRQRLADKHPIIAQQQEQKDNNLVKLSMALHEAEAQLRLTLGGAQMDRMHQQIPGLLAQGRPGHVAVSYMLEHQLTQSRGGFVDWNQRFQSMLDWPEATAEDKLVKYNALMNMAKDFTFSAELVAKLIINELSLPEPLKTVRSCETFGGHAGGKKYVANATLFKVAQDEHGLYGSDAFAQKAAGHELKGLAAYFDCRIAGLHVPLTCIIDYRGYRVICSSLVPVDHSTLCYGSADGGRTVHDDNPTLARKMREAAQLLNLAAHECGVREHKVLANENKKQ